MIAIIVLKKRAKGESSPPILQGLASETTPAHIFRKGNSWAEVNAIKKKKFAPLKHSLRFRALIVSFHVVQKSRRCLGFSFSI